MLMHSEKGIETVKDKINNFGGMGSRYNTIQSHDHGDSWIGEVISRGLKKNRNVKCFNCDKHEHLKGDFKQDITRNNIFSKHSSNRIPLTSGLCRKYGKGRHWTNDCRSTEGIQGNALLLENSLRGLSQAFIPYLVQTFPQEMYSKKY